MSENSSAKYYQENIARLQKKVRERNQNIAKEEKEKKNEHMAVNDTEIYRK